MLYSEFSRGSCIIEKSFYITPVQHFWPHTSLKDSSWLKKVTSFFGFQNLQGSWKQDPGKLFYKNSIYGALLHSMSEEIITKCSYCDLPFNMIIHSHLEFIVHYTLCS